MSHDIRINLLGTIQTQHIDQYRSLLILEEGSSVIQLSDARYGNINNGKGLNNLDTDEMHNSNKGIPPIATISPRIKMR